MSSNCPLCGNQSSGLFDERKFRGHLVTNRICDHCGLVYQSPRMTDAELSSYYEREYRLEYQGVEGPSPKDLAIQSGRAESLAQFLRSKLATVTRHLDIGCSAGLWLLRTQEIYRCQLVGIEPGTAYRKFAQDKGLTVYPNIVDLEETKPEKFDLISMLHVLEHLPDPVGYLTHIRTSLMEDHAHLLIEVPNLYAHECFETAHLVSYSSHTLTRVLKKAGYVVETLKAHGRPRSAVIPLYLTLIARPVSETESVLWSIVPERSVVLKRKIGMLRRKILTRLLPAKAWQQPGKIQ